MIEKEDLNSVPPCSDGCRVEVVAEGLTLFRDASWPWTPQWCHHCTGTLPTEEGQTLRTVWHCRRPGDAKKGRTPSCAGRLVVVAGEVGGNQAVGLRQGVVSAATDVRQEVDMPLACYSATARCMSRSIALQRTVAPASR